MLILGRYRVVKVLGRGAFGEVLEVEDAKTGAPYAIKYVPPELARDSAQMLQIRANFNLVSRLTHPHISTTRFLEEDAATGQVYLILDLVRGCGFKEWLARWRMQTGDPNASLPVKLALGVAEQIAAALDYAHSQPVSYDASGKAARYGILHRDLKPDNVMVETSREYRPGIPYVKLVDFGLAAEIQASMQSRSLVQREDNFGGTPSYMAPEQWEGRTLTRGVDQWALGVMIYEMAAGRLPFGGPNMQSLERRVLEANPEPPPALTAAQWAILRGALHRDRRQRHRSCTALVRALADSDSRTANSVAQPLLPLPDEFQGIESSQQPPATLLAPPPTTSAARPDHGKAVLLAVALVLALILLAGGAVGFWVWNSRPGPQPVPIATADRLAAERAAEEADWSEAELAVKEAGDNLFKADTAYENYLLRRPAGAHAELAKQRRAELERRKAETKSAAERLRQELEQRERYFQELIGEANRLAATQPEAALDKLAEAERKGRADPGRQWPDLLASLNPSLEARRREAERRAAERYGQRRTEALQAQAALEVTREELREALARMEREAATGKEPALARLKSLCDRHPSGAAKRQEGERAYVFGQALLSEKKPEEAVKQFRAAEEALKVCAAWWKQAEQASREEIAARQKLQAARERRLDEERKLLAYIETALEAAEARFSAGELKEHAELLRQIPTALAEVERCAAARREALQAQAQAEPFSTRASLAGRRRSAKEALVRGDLETARGGWAAALKEYGEAKSGFEEVLTQSREEVAGRIKSAKEQQAAGEHEAALATLESVLRADPRHAEALRLKPILEAARDFSRAMSAGRTAREKQPPDLDAAAAAYQQALKLKPGDAAAEQALAEIRSARSQLEHQALLAAALAELKGEAVDGQGRYSNLGDAKRQKVEELLSRVLALKPGEPQAQALMSKLVWPKQLVLQLNRTVKLELLLLPSGRFEMGSPVKEKDRMSYEDPQHEVILTQPFYLGKFEVTQEQYEAIMERNPSQFREPSNPVEQVSWEDAQEFCKRLSQKTGKTVRLPTEAEWEYACRAGTTTRFSNGDGDRGLEEAAWYGYDQSGRKTHPVGQKKPNAWGLYDMHGNVWEWCQDWYGPYEKGEARDPAGPKSGKYRVLRGGSWNFEAKTCRSANRHWESSSLQVFMIGFRVAVSLARP